jgi:hypothetical protein
MARLKVKQIADFNTAVQTLIDNDADQNASIIAQISEDLSSEVSATNSDVTSIDAVLAGLAGATTVTSLETRISRDEVALTDAVGSLEDLISDNDTYIGDVSDALSAEISTTDEEVGSLEDLISDNLVAIGDNGSYIDDVSADLSAEISATDVEVGSLEDLISDNLVAIGDNSTAISAILAGSDVNLDTFAEVISYVDSLDTADGGALTSQIASIDARVSANTSSDAVLSAALSAEISATNSDVVSIDAVLAGVGTSANITSLDTYIDGVSTALSTEISSTNSEVLSLDAYIDGVSADLSAEIASTGSEIADLQTADLRLHQFGTFVNPTSFTVALAVDVTATADTLVFVNGHNIHVEVEGLDGWSSPDGQIFNLANIGYDLDAEDHIYVVAPRA